MKENKKSPVALVAGILVLIAALAVTVYGYATKTEAEVTKEHTIIIFGLIFTVVGFAWTVTALVSYFSKGSVLTNGKSSEKVLFLAQAALFAALSYIGFQFFKFDIPVGTEKTAFHLGNTFCVLAALFLGGSWGGMAGAVGMTIADMTAGYMTSAPKTFLLKLCIGLIVGFVAHKLFRLSKPNSEKKITVAVIVSSICGMAFNVVADPVVGYFYKTYLMGVPQDASKLLAKISAVTTLVNAITSVVFASIIYLALRPVLTKAGLFVRLDKSNDKDAVQ